MNYSVAVPGFRTYQPPVLLFYVICSHTHAHQESRHWYLLSITGTTNNLARSRSSVFSLDDIRNFRRYAYCSLKSDSVPHFCNKLFTLITRISVAKKHAALPRPSSCIWGDCSRQRKWEGNRRDGRTSSRKSCLCPYSTDPCVMFFSKLDLFLIKWPK